MRTRRRWRDSEVRGVRCEVRVDTAHSHLDPRTSHLLSYVRCVPIGRQQLTALAGILEAELDHPAVTVGVCVDEGWLLVEPSVHLDHFAGKRAEELGHRLHRLDRSENIHASVPRADL